MSLCIARVRGTHIANSNAHSLAKIKRSIITKFESGDFVQWITELGTELHYNTPEMHSSKTTLNMLRIEVGHKNAFWSNKFGKPQLVLNVTKQKTTQTSPPLPQSWGSGDDSVCRSTLWYIQS